MIRRLSRHSLRYFFCNNNNNNNNNQSKQYKDYDRVFVNQDKIKKKMQQIKRRKNKVVEQQTKISDLMPEIGTYKPFSQIEKFRMETQSSNLFAFEESNVKESRLLNIQSYTSQAIQVNRQLHPPSLILYDSQVLVWEVQRAIDIRIQHFDILKILKPKPQYIILAVNDISNIKLKFQDLQKLRQIADVDVLQIFQAIGTFNMASQDEVKVIMFIISQ